MHAGFHRLLHDPESELKDCTFKQVVDWYFSFFKLTEITRSSHGGVYANILGELHDADIYYTCTCPPFHKEFYCKHVLGFAMHKNLIPIPDCCKKVAPKHNGKKHYAHRPAKTPGALEKLPGANPMIQKKQKRGKPK